MFYYGVVLIGEHLRSSLEEYVLANKTNLEHEINIEFVDGFPPLAVMLVRCYPNVTFPRLQKDLTYEEEVKWGQELSGKHVFFFLPDVCKSRPGIFQPCVGVREVGSLLDDVLGIHQCVYFFCHLTTYCVTSRGRCFTMQHWTARKRG